MFVLFFAGVTTAYWAEARGNPIHAARGIDLADDRRRIPAATWKGKEVRFGIANSALYATVTTDASCGAVNCHARLVHAVRRPRADGEHAARRSGVRRRRARGSTACS